MVFEPLGWRELRELREMDRLLVVETCAVEALGA
jgi:hypothetical protein